MNEDRIIIEVEVNAGKSAEDLANVRSRMDALKDAQKTLKKEMKELQTVQLKNGQLNNEDAKTLAELNKQYANNAADLKQLTAQEKVYTAQIQIATQNDRKYGDSITELGAQLAQLKQEYRSLSAEQRESAEGKEMLEQIRALDEQVKEADYSLGDFQRNVGNYSSALLGLGGNASKVAALFQNGLSNGIQTAGVALKNFGKAILATPVGWILGALAAVKGAFEQIQEAIQRSDELGTEVQKSMAGWEAVKTQWREGWGVMAEYAVKALTTVMKTIQNAQHTFNTFLAFLHGGAEQMRQEASYYEDLQTQWEDLTESEDKYEEKERSRWKTEALSRQQIAQLNKQYYETDRKNVAERNRILDEMDKNEKDIAKTREDNARMYYENMKKRAELTKDTSDEMQNNIAKAYAAMIEAETEYLNTSARLEKRRAQLRQQEQQEDEAERQRQQQAAREAAQRRKEALENEEAALRALQDLRREMLKDEDERGRQTITDEYSRQIADLEKRLESEAGLTAKARGYIEEQITLLRTKMEDELAKYEEEIAKRRREEEEKRMENIRKEAEAEAALRVQLMEDGMSKELETLVAGTRKTIEELEKKAEAEGATAEEVARIHEQILLNLELYQKREAEIRRKYADKLVREEQARLKKRFDNELKAALLEAGDDKAAAAEIELEAARRMYDELLNMDEQTRKAMYKTDEDYYAARLAAEEKVSQAEKKSAEAQQARVREIGATLQTVGDALSGLYESIAGDSETFEQFKKATAIADATIGMATAIASAVAASTEGDPYTMAIRIATNVAAVTAQFAALIKAIKAAVIPSAPAFAEGGIVPGDSWTGDKVTARVNSGEMILTKEQQAKLFDLIQAGVPQGGIDYRLLARAVAEGVAALPAPVLDYSEFTRFERKVKQVERFTRL